MQNATYTPQDVNEEQSDTLKIQGEEHRVAYHIHPLKPIRARDPAMCVTIVETIHGLMFPHIVRASKGDKVFRYTVNELGYRYPNQKPSPFDIENTTRPNTFAEAQELAALAVSRPVPANGEDDAGDADEF